MSVSSDLNRVGSCVARQFGEGRGAVDQPRPQLRLADPGWRHGAFVRAGPGDGIDYLLAPAGWEEYLAFSSAQVDPTRIFWPDNGLLCSPPAPGFGTAAV